MLKDKPSREEGGQPQPAGKRDYLWRRAAMIQSMRRFFMTQGYLEVETPVLIPAPAPELHIDALSCGDWFLHTSPELCMKRLIAAGHPRLFQICRCFRSQERGERHLPEFTMLEWYQAGSDYKKMMSECEAMLSFVFDELECGTALSYRGRLIDLQPPWEMITVADAFTLYAPLSLSEAFKTDCFDEMMACHIEPELGLIKPTFLYDYPLHPGCLAKAKQDNPLLAERFELYIGGLELANAFSELTDAEEQRRRFEASARERSTRGKSAYPVAENFLAALSSLPEAAGIAMGIDRLAMILTDRPTIDDVVAFVPENL